MTAQEKLEAALKLALENDACLHMDFQRFAAYVTEGMRLVTHKKGDILAYDGAPLKHVTLLLSGRCRVIKYSRAGKGVFTGVAQPPQIFGLYELVKDYPAHTATLQALSDCRLLEVDPAFYRSCLERCQKIALYSLRYLAGFVDDILNRSDNLSLHTSRENLLLYFYEACSDKKFPLRLDVKKEEIAAALGMNPRTLYRKLGELRAEGYIGKSGGKVSIDQSQFTLIHKAISDLL